ncbi:mCG114056, partial [Mus musculus]
LRSRRLSQRIQPALDQDIQHIVNEHGHIRKKSSKCNELRNVIHESPKSTPYNTNQRDDATLQSSNLKRHKTGTTKEVCTYKDCVDHLKGSSIISLNQGTHIEKKEHNRNKNLDEVLVSKHKPIVRQNNSEMNTYTCGEFDKCFTQSDNLQSQQRIYPGKNSYKYSESDKCFTQPSFIQERNLTNVVNATNALLTKAVSEFIREFIQERNRTNAVSVTNALLTKAI